MNSKTTRRIVGCVAALAVVVGPALAAADQFGTDDLIPAMDSGQAYSERYSFSVDFDDGGHVGMDWTISNLGVRSGYGASEVRLRHPQLDNYHRSERESSGNWSYDSDEFGLDIADATIEAVDDGVFKLEYAGDDIRIELTFDNTIEMWRPATGGIEYGGDYYRFTMVSPRADVSGRIYRNGQWHDVTGTQSGYADHVATNVAPFDMATRFTRFRQYDDEVFVMWREVALTDDFGGGTETWIVVGVDDEIIYEDTNPDVRFGDVETDDETGYYIPHAVQVVSEARDRKLQLTLRKDEHHRTDLLEQHGTIARFVASAVSDPYQYDIHGDYALQVKVGDNQLRTLDEGHVTIDYVNQ